MIYEVLKLCFTNLCSVIYPPAQRTPGAVRQGGIST